MPRHLVSRVIQEGRSEPVETDWLTLTPEQRIDGVWLLQLRSTKHSKTDEPFAARVSA